jgi:hypothetical protein
MSVNGFDMGSPTGPPAGAFGGTGIGAGTSTAAMGRPVAVIRGNGIVAHNVCCYGCGNSLVAKAMIMNCQCTFCEDCMSQFMGNSEHCTCPSCGTKTTFISEVAVSNLADADTFDKDSSIIDEILTTSHRKGFITLDQMCSNLLREYEKHDRRTSLLFLQMSKQNRKFNHSHPSSINIK